MKWILGVLIAAALTAGYLVGPARTFEKPDLARIVFIHLPCAFSATIYFIWAAWCSLQVLRGKLEADHKARAAHELGLLIGIVTLVTGMEFSFAQWGAAWSWDPRQTSFLVVMLIYGAYFAVRSAFEDSSRGVKAAAAYSVASVLPTLFFIFVLPRLPQVAKSTLHPNNTVAGGMFSPDYYGLVFGSFILFMILFSWIGRLAARTYQLEENQHARLDIGGGPSSSAVVRPVSVSEEN